MKIRPRPYALFALLLVVHLAGAQTDPAAVLDALHRAGNEGDQTAFVALWSEQGVLLPSDGRQRLSGGDLETYIASGDPWTFRNEARTISLSLEGTTAWFDEALVDDECRWKS